MRKSLRNLQRVLERNHTTQDLNTGALLEALRQLIARGEYDEAGARLSALEHAIAQVQGRTELVAISATVQEMLGKLRQHQSEQGERLRSATQQRKRIQHYRSVGHSD